jgi:hypothetical protein
MSPCPPREERTLPPAERVAAHVQGHQHCPKTVSVWRTVWLLGVA